MIQTKRDCLCCKKKLPTDVPRTCPECGHVFRGNGWDGIDAHWRAHHEKNGVSYANFWNSLCRDHGGPR